MKIILRLAVMLSVLAASINGAAETPENLGLARWNQFETMLEHYRLLVVKSEARDEQIRKEVEEFIDIDSKLQIASISNFFKKDWLMLLVTDYPKASPGIPEAELASRILSNITEIESTLLGFHPDLVDNTSLLERLEVAIRCAKEMETTIPTKQPETNEDTPAKDRGKGEQGVDPNA